MVDQTALKVNQAGIVTTVLVAFLLSMVFWPAVVLIPALALVLLAGTFWPSAALFKQLYFRVLEPRGVLHQARIHDDPAPHNFAQGFGGVVLVIAALLLLIAPIIGLALALLVALLALVNLAFGFCLGCQIYYQLGRRGLLKA